MKRTPRLQICTDVALLKPSWAVLGRSCGFLLRSWAVWEPTRGGLEDILVLSWSDHAPSWTPRHSPDAPRRPQDAPKTRHVVPRGGTPAISKPSWSKLNHHGTFLGPTCELSRVTFVVYCAIFVSSRPIFGVASWTQHSANGPRMCVKTAYATLQD